MDLTVGAMLSLPFSAEPGTDSGRWNPAPKSGTTKVGPR